MSFWKPSPQCSTAARKCARDLLTHLLGRASTPGSRPKYIIINNMPVLASELAKFDATTCPKCSAPHSPEYIHDNGDSNGSTSPPPPTYLFVPMILRIPITSIPDEHRDAASTTQLAKRVTKRVTSTSSKLDVDALTAILRLQE
jgi:hypothetical protein